jgi:hypothetical protein
VLNSAKCLCNNTLPQQRLPFRDKLCKYRVHRNVDVCAFAGEGLIEIGDARVPPRMELLAVPAARSWQGRAPEPHPSPLQALVLVEKKPAAGTK